MIIILQQKELTKQRATFSSNVNGSREKEATWASLESDVVKSRPEKGIGSRTIFIRHSKVCAALVLGRWGILCEIISKMSIKF